MNELVEELRQLQIRQTEIIGQLLQPEAADARTEAGPRVVPPDDVDDADRPLRIGDHVRVLNPDGIRSHRDTVYTVVKIRLFVTTVAPNGVKVVRAAHNLERV
jgi:hypothetical protein